MAVGGGVLVGVDIGVLGVVRGEVGVKVANTAVGIPLGVGATNKVAVGVGESVGVGVGM